ncbi:MAG: M48 family metallopeptidase [Alphaproteobacteria bacterium]
MSFYLSKSAKYYDGKTGTPHDVSLILTGTTLQLMEGGALLETWNGSAVTVIDHPAPPVPGIFGYTENQDARLYIDNEKEWKTLYIRLPKSSKKVITLPTNWSSFFIYAFVSILSLYFLFLLFPRIIERTAYLIPAEVERSIGQQVANSMTKNYDLCTAPAGTQAMQKVFNTMTAQASRDISYEIYVVENDFMPNAFAAPGGYLIVFSEVIERAETPEEVFGVLAHEIAHVDLYHTTKGIMRDLGMRFVLSMMVGGTSIEGAASFFSQMNYSREDESEADLYGRAIMIEAGINPKGMRHFFESIQKWEGDFYTEIEESINEEIEKEEDKIELPSMDFFNQPFWEYLSTHPNTDKRIEKLRSLENDASFAPVLNDEEWQSLKDICSETKKFKL